MQTFIQVLSSKGPSLRERIADDPRLVRYHLYVLREQTPGRSPGWMKVRSTDAKVRGAINIEWDPPLHIMNCRIVTKGRGKPNVIAADFIEYLLARHWRRIQSIEIARR